MLAHHARPRKTKVKVTPRPEIPETVEFFRGNRLPKVFRPYRKFINRLPLFLIEEIVNTGIAARSNDKLISEAFEIAVEFEETAPHRCSACFAWEKDDLFIPTFFVIQGKFHIFATCDPCMAKIKAGQTPEGFWKNIADHGMGGAE